VTFSLYELGGQFNREAELFAMAHRRVGRPEPSAVRAVIFFFLLADVPETSEGRLRSPFWHPPRPVPFTGSWKIFLEQNRPA